jgi:hypothetical protein
LKNQKNEKDFVILGDMNIKNCDELSSFMPPGFVSLNDTCLPTNTSKKGKPYDHVLYRPSFSNEELGMKDNFEIIDLVSTFKPLWNSDEPYPGDPYHHNKFRQYFSDHHPVTFNIRVNDNDD